ncbi:hypothetical protein VPNG_02927 [Cytospora leucostoma]|uniref:C3H1-type domain-containing protein n=1 Tax=Cytospora leucostoma TaxID=1230097 RepID=A0A423XGP8_9PEZI|nr:hypothetical protein VPNG_02927 [Cytospora leucostoma]
MLFLEEDSPLLKAWIVKRLENTSDADADVLADYVLALLHHDDGSEDVKAKCQTEMSNFLTEDASVFVNDLFEAIKYKSYVPGAPPPPRSQPAGAPQTILPGLGATTMNQPSIPTGPAGGARKRGFQERGDFDAPNGREQVQGGRAFKQARRGARFGGPRGYVDPDRPRPPPQEQFGYPNAPSFPQPGQAPSMPQFDLSNPMEAMRQLQQLSQQMGLQMPPFPDYSLQQPQGYQHQRMSQHGRKKCWDYEKKGYCPRGLNCKFEHSTGTEPVYNNLPAPQASGQIQLPNEGWFGSSLLYDAPDGNGDLPSPAGSPAIPDVNASFNSFDCFFGMPGLMQQAEYDPNSATVIQPPQMPQFPAQSIPTPSNGHYNNHNREDRQGQQRRRMGGPRAPFSAEGPVHDRTQTKVVVESIPEENFEEDQIRAFFSQFGNIEEVTMMPYKRLAVVKYDNWVSANAAYKSPKVIFENRFVKVFWYKEEKHADLANGGANGTKNGVSANGTSRLESAEPKLEEIDMEEFNRKQEEAQKLHEEKLKKKQEIERQRAELEKKQKELQAKQAAERQRLLAKIASSSRKNSTGASGDGSGTEAKEGTTSKTEALRATLAKLQEEANALGIDPDGVQQEDDAMVSTYPPAYGRGGRGGYYRGRGGFTPRASFRGSGRGGRGHIQAAYAAFSLDNRPRTVAVRGVDFTTPEKGEALRRHLFVLPEGSAEVQVTPTVTHVNFSDRKSAEAFYYSVKDKRVPGIEGEVELSWVANTAGPLPNSTINKVNLGANVNENGGTGVAGHDDEGLDTDMADDAAANKGVDQNGGQPQGQHEVKEAKEAAGDLDYDVAGDNEWDIA